MIHLLFFSYPTNLRLVIDLQKCVKAQQNVAYARKVKISNLQQMAETLIFLQENQFDSLEQLQHESDTISKQIDNLSDQKIPTGSNCRFEHKDPLSWTVSCKQKYFSPC